MTVYGAPRSSEPDDKPNQPQQEQPPRPAPGGGAAQAAPAPAPGTFQVAPGPPRPLSAPPAQRPAQPAPPPAAAQPAPAQPAAQPGQAGQFGRPAGGTVLGQASGGPAPNGPAASAAVPVAQPSQQVAQPGQPGQPGQLGQPGQQAARLGQPGQQAAQPGQQVAVPQGAGTTVTRDSQATQALSAQAAQARLAAQAASQAQGASQALATAQAAGRVYGNSPGEDPVLELTPDARPLTKLRIGTHLANREALKQLQVGAPGMGLLLGRDREKQPVMIRFFRPEPTRIALVGGIWAAQLTAFRALALGVRIVVFTSQPDQWQSFGQWATGRSDRVAVLTTERPITVRSTPNRPTMLVYDVGPLGPARRPQLGPWQTQLTVLRQLTAFGFPALQESSLVMFQRLAPEEAVAATSVLQLSKQTTYLLQSLRDDMVTLLGGEADRYVWVQPTAVELGQLGQPHR